MAAFWISSKDIKWTLVNEFQTCILVSKGRNDSTAKQVSLKQYTLRNLNANDATIILQKTGIQKLL